MIETNTPGDEQALAALKKIHELGGTVLTTEEAMVFIASPIYLGPPARLSKPKRGPHSRDTQYQRSFERRRGLYQRLVRNPKSARLGGEATRKLGQQTRDEISRLAARLTGKIKKRKLASNIYAILWQDKSRKAPPDLRTIREILRTLNGQV